MKYFYISPDGDIDRDIMQSYEDYIKQVYAKFPSAVKVLADHEDETGSVSLNDATVMGLNIDLALRIIKLTMAGDYQGGPRGHGQRTFHLFYRGVQGFSGCCQPWNVGPSLDGYGDHLFNEFEVLADDRFEHRMLFATGIEVAIQFQDLDLTYINDEPWPPTILV